jgi:sec-independent protein translocase protein TatB
MFGIGTGEIVIILVLALILLGPQRLPDAAKQIGKGLREFRKATEDLKQQFESELYALDDSKKPTLVPPASSQATIDAATGTATVPPGGVPLSPPGDVPAATADNVPGLDAALVEVKPAAAAPAAEGVPKVS